MLVKTSFLMIIILAMANVQQCQNHSTLKQGIKGRVLWLEGNMMPGPGVNLPPGKPVEREIMIYEPTTMEQVKGSGSLFSEVNSRRIKTVKSNEDGYFAVALDTGKYSVFVKEDGKFFASQMDEKHFSPVTVKKDSVAEIEIKINYKAYY